MHTSDSRPQQRKQRRKRRDGEATREKIIVAAIELLSEEGLSGISTGKLSKRAGIVQSGFYAHFESVEECTLVAAERIGRRIREVVVYKMGGDTVDPAALSRGIQELLETLEKEWKFIELMLRYRKDPSPLGKVMARFYDQVRADVINNLTEVAPELDLRSSERPLLVPAAHMIVTQFVVTLECLAEGWARDRAVLAGQLTAQVQLAANQAYDSVARQRSQT